MAMKLGNLLLAPGNIILTLSESQLPHLKYKVDDNLSYLFHRTFARPKQDVFKSWLYTVKVRDDSIISTETTALGHARTR